MDTFGYMVSECYWCIKKKNTKQLKNGFLSSSCHPLSLIVSSTVFLTRATKGMDPRTAKCCMASFFQDQRVQKDILNTLDHTKRSVLQLMMLHTPIGKNHLQADWRNMSACKKPYLSPARWWKAFLHPQCSLRWGAFLWRCGAQVKTSDWKFSTFLRAIRTMNAIHPYYLSHRPHRGLSKSPEFKGKRHWAGKMRTCRCNCTQQKLQVARGSFVPCKIWVETCAPSFAGTGRSHCVCSAWDWNTALFGKD